jgi:exopolysaccharide production protein ExoY
VDVSAEWLDQPDLDAIDVTPPHQAQGLVLQRIIDVVIVVLAIFAVLPLMLMIALFIWLNEGGSVFFGQVRVGRMGQLFRCWKFRTMVVNAEQALADHLANDPEARADWEASHKLRNDPRITPFGRFLRASSLDELPQLLNVLVGEMSLVGPRPIVLAEIARYKSNFCDYCRCRPGITGLWQVSGRNDVSYDMRVELDIQYARSRTAWLDVKIMAATVPAVLARRGSY